MLLNCLPYLKKCKYAYMITLVSSFTASSSMLICSSKPAAAIVVSSFNSCLDNPVEVNEVSNELVNDGASTSNEAVCDGASFSCENEKFQENVQQMSCQTRCLRVKQLILGRLWFCKTKFLKATFCFF